MLKRVEDRLQQLLKLEENWDSYGANKIDPRSVEAAKRLLDIVMSYEPAVVPTSPGGVQLEWHRDGVELEIEIGPDGQVVYD